MEKVKDHYRNLIIGFGKGGKTLAAWLSSIGEEVAVIEKSEKMYGGACINIACIPSKSLITDAEKGISYGKAHNIKETLVATLRQKNYDKIAEQEKATVIDGTASFLSSESVKVKTAEGERSITAERIFINTGTRPFLPKIKGAEGENIYTSTSLMELEEKPKRLAIVGGGFIGLEFADMFLKFGSEVTLVDRSKDFLSREDRDVADAIYKVLTEKGLKILSGSIVEHLAQRDAAVEIGYKKDNTNQSFLADKVLMATGREAVTEALNLNVAGIETDKRGFIKVNDRLQTSADNVWALGDVNGGPQFTYISLDDFRIIKNQISGGTYNSTTKRKQYATTLFTTPPYARIGMNEQEAAEKGLDYSVYRLSASSIPKAAIFRQKEGLLKAIVEKDTGQILGCVLYCAEAHEIINIVQLAMNTGTPYVELRDAIYTHPSMAESLNDLFS